MKSFAPSSLLALWLLSVLAGCPHTEETSQTSSATPAAESSATAVAPSPNPWPVPKRMPTGAEGELVAYGKELVEHTGLHLGPDAPDIKLRLAGNRLSCNNCHLDAGQRREAMGFVGVAQRFPADYAPLGRKITLAERIDACFERSLAGKPLPAEGRELKALVAYLTWLSQDVAAGQITQPGPEAIEPPARAANPAAGAKLYAYHCAACHGNKGEGLREDEKKLSAGYTFPPLWGDDSFSNGSNMARQLVATRFIQANMPLGRPVLTTGDAYDIAAYMLSQPRPAYALAGKDYPDAKTRPVDLPYGPYPDKAPEARHRLGPYDGLLKPAG